ncbi:ribonucleotide reductase subunit alpha [Brevundimonas sp.]|uniref:ribonucleotide reductase subunit alpha n=1 Tax=Brevundimonas sp. TaxID=1871086 RepID=UPI003A8D952E
MPHRMNRNMHFAQLLAAAAAEPQPQRLLFVFAGAELPDRATPEQVRLFNAGKGGALTPQMCVDKAPADLADFAALVAESRRAGPPWSVVFAASLGGHGGQAPDAEKVQQALQIMVEAVRTGQIKGFAAYDTEGEFIELN